MPQTEPCVHISETALVMRARPSSWKPVPCSELRWCMSAFVERPQGRCAGHEVGLSVTVLLSPHQLAKLSACLVLWLLQQGVQDGVPRCGTTLESQRTRALFAACPSDAPGRALLRAAAAPS